MYQENPALRLEYKKVDTKNIVKYKENIDKEDTKKIQKFMSNIEKRDTKKKKMWKVENFLRQVEQGPYYISTTCHRSWYQKSFRLFKREKYHILTVELFQPVKSLDEKLDICKTFTSIFIKMQFPARQSAIKWL